MRLRHQHTPEPQGIDDWTGFKVPLSRLRKEWDHLLTTDPDVRNPQDFVRGVPDNIALPYARPETPDIFVALNIDTEQGIPIFTESGDAVLDQGVLPVL